MCFCCVVRICSAYCLALFGFVCFVFKICSASLAILKRGSFDLFVRISAMQIIGSGQIATSLHLSYQHFLAALRFLIFSFCLALLLILLSLLECAGEFRSCGSDEDAVPRPCKPLKRLDRNFKCFGAVTFAWFSWFCAVLPPRLLSLGSYFLGCVQIKK